MKKKKIKVTIKDTDPKYTSLQKSIIMAGSGSKPITHKQLKQKVKDMGGVHEIVIDTGVIEFLEEIGLSVDEFVKKIKKAGGIK